MTTDNPNQPAGEPEITYTGRRGDDENAVLRDGVPLPLHLDVRNHSPTGFAWGYGGSGPAQLALALCVDVLGDPERALSIYQQVKWALVARWPMEKDWQASRREILAVISDAERRAGGDQA